MRKCGGIARRGWSGLALVLTMAAIGAGPAAQAAEEEEGKTTLAETLVTASRLGEGITGASTTVITSEEIERSPGQSLPEILARVPGIRVSDLYGGVNGAKANIDMRGFGSTASSNTLILLNGHRLNDFDSAEVELGAINLANVERIEVIRGNAGAVLYGDGAVGGVINIITKNAANTSNLFQAEAAVGSLGYRQGTLTAIRKIGDTALSWSGSETTSDGDRDNNKLRQRNVMGEVRHALDGGEIYLNLAANDEKIQYPGGVTLADYNRGQTRGTKTPYDFGNQQSVNLALGGTADLAAGIELVLDAGLRHRDQQALLSYYGANSTYDSAYSTFSFTPRLNAESHLAGMPNRLTSGLDFYQYLYDQDRASQIGGPFTNRYHLQQNTVALYGQDTVSVRPDTDLSLGARVERSAVSAVQRSASPGTPHDGDDFNYAAHLGIEHRFLPDVTAFGRLGRSFRLPNIDERVGMGSPTDLKAQTSQDIEAGLRGTVGRFGYQSSVYLMDLRDELHYDPVTYTNRNLDPTRRYGWESGLTLRVRDDLRLKGGLAYTRATFREGAFKGNDVPLVAPWTGTAGLSWDAWEKYVVVDLDARYLGSRRADGDEANVYQTIDPSTVVDLRVGGELSPVTWSVTVQNLLNERYYEYAAAGPGYYSVYPLSGRTMIGRLGVKF